MLSLRASSYAKPILRAINIMDIEQLHKDIYAAQQSDQHCKDIITNITNPEFPDPEPDPCWSLDDQQLLCYDNRIWIPDANDLWLQILLNKHNHLLSGHYGQSKTMDRVPHGYTAGWVFPHRTRTHGHRNPRRVRPIPYCNSRGVQQNLQFHPIKIL